MGKFIDLTGQRFGRLTVVERANKPGEGSYVKWLCRCDCGNTKIYKTAELRSKGVVSCGCWQRENAAGNLNRMQRSAKLGFVSGTNISRIRSTTLQRNNSTGYPGVSVYRTKNAQIKYRADYYFQGKRHTLGVFDTPEKASEVREKAVEAARAPIIEAYANGTMERRCAVCGNLFMPSHPRQIICSPECKKKRHSAQVASYQRAKAIRDKAARAEKALRTEREEAATDRIPFVYCKHGRWVAIINQQYLGSFDTQREAATAVEQYRSEHPEYKPQRRYGCKRYEGQEVPPDPNADKPKLPCVYYMGRRWLTIIKSQRLGSFDTQEEAAAAVEQYKSEHPEYKPRKRHQKKEAQKKEACPMNDNQFEACYMEALTINDKDAYISDMALSSIWGDADDADIPPEHLEALGRIWEVAHMSMRDIRKSAGLTQAAFAQKFLIPKRTIENWESNVNTPPEYVKVLIAKAIGLC